jgi:hypothetical protein
MEDVNARHSESGCDIDSSEMSDSSVERAGHGGRTTGTSSKLPTLRYIVTDVPPWHVCLILGFQVGN